MAKKLTKSQKELSEKQLTELATAFDNDIGLAQFFMHWIENGQNATEAYLSLGTGVSRQVAMVMGHRYLKRIDVPVALGLYNLGMDRYLKKLDEGLEAKQNKVMTTKSGNTIDMSGPDHEVQKYYHEKLGKLLGVEVETKHNGINLTLNQQINQSVDQDRKQYE